MSDSIQRSNSISESDQGNGSGTGVTATSVSRSNTLRKRASMQRSGSLKRSSSRRSFRAGSVRSLALQSNVDEQDISSAFYCPVPTSGNPTEVLANRFQAWRKILKDITAYFREIQSHYEQRSKSLLKLSNVLNNTQTPPGFLSAGGIDDAIQILRNYNKQAIAESNKAREIEEDVILALSGLRSDLQQKIKEIKNLSGDFKNTVDKEIAATKRAVGALEDVLGRGEVDSASTNGKEDPYLLRMAVDRQLERQLDEENYLHQAYLNLEKSGRELESIVVGEIQKSYNAYAGILKRESEVGFKTIDELRFGPVAMNKDQEWVNFVKKDNQFVDPDLPMRTAQFISYPGQDHYACQEIRAGLLERKTKYLRSYTAGWYVLSPTHLHEFKSADKTQSPIMSLYLADQKLGSRSQVGGNSPKFILKGRQTGGVHRGHSWIFRAESFDTMLAWYEDIKALTEKSPQERSDFVRGHSRSFSRASTRSVSSDGVVDEEDDEPFAAYTSAAAPANLVAHQDTVTRRPSPGGRFPSDLQVNAARGLQAPLSPASLSSEAGSGVVYGKSMERETYSDSYMAAAAALPGSGVGNQTNFGGSHEERYGNVDQTSMTAAHSAAAQASREGQEEGINPYTNEPLENTSLPVAAPTVMNTTHQHLLGAQAEFHELPAPSGQQDYEMTTALLDHTLVSSPGTSMLATTLTPGAATPSARAHDADGMGIESGPRKNRPGAVLRTDTASDLHIPGGFPKASGSGT